MPSDRLRDRGRRRNSLARAVRHFCLPFKALADFASWLFAWIGTRASNKVARTSISSLPSRSTLAQRPGTKGKTRPPFSNSRSQTPSGWTKLAQEEILEIQETNTNRDVLLQSEGEHDLIGAALVASAALGTTVRAQEVISNPGYCAFFHPNANCQNKGPGNPYTANVQPLNHGWRRADARRYRNTY